MKYDLISDFHLEMNVLYKDTRFWEEDDPFTYAWHKDRKSEILVVAGDLSNEVEFSKAVLLEASMYYEVVLFVDGNHDSYGCTQWIECSSMESGGYWLDVSTVAEETQKLATFADEVDNIGYLNGTNTFFRDGTLFIGANGWYNFEVPMTVKFGDRVKAWMENTNDPLRLNWGANIRSDRADGPLDLARTQARLLKEQVENAQDDPAVKEIVVVTHVPPTDKVLLKLGDNKLGHLAKANGAYYNGFMRDVVKADGKGKIKVWNFGHTHFPHDLVDRGVRYVCNPRGYRSERRKMGGFKGIIQVDTEASPSAFGEVE